MQEPHVCTSGVANAFVWLAGPRSPTKFIHFKLHARLIRGGPCKTLKVACVRKCHHGNTTPLSRRQGVIQIRGNKRRWNPNLELFPLHQMKYDRDRIHISEQSEPLDLKLEAGTILSERQDKRSDSYWNCNFLSLILISLPISRNTWVRSVEPLRNSMVRGEGSRGYCLEA